MNRRNMLKVAGLTAATMAVSAEAKELEKKETKEEKSSFNREEMKPKDSKNMSKGELKHSPDIAVKDKDAQGYTLVAVSVGKEGIVHPSTKEHWIDFIELYADDTLVGKITLEGEISRGATCFAVKLDGVKTLKSKAGCNLHGVWTTTINL